MAATEILAPGTTATQSTDFTQASGAVSTLILKGAAGVKATGNSFLLLEIKTDDDTYLPVATLTPSTPIYRLDLVGDFRVRRTAGVTSCGCDRAA